MDPLPPPSRPAPPAPDDARSFSERYGGTAPDATASTSRLEFEDHSAGARGGGMKMVAIALGVVVLLLVGLGGAAMSIRTSSPQIDRPALVPRYAATSPRPSGATTPSPRPTASTDPSEPTGTGGPPPPQPTGPLEPLRGRDAVIDAMVAEMNRVQTAHVELKGATSVEGINIRMTGAYDVNSSDVAGWLNIRGGGLGLVGREELVIKDGTMYTRAQGGAWASRRLTIGEEAGLTAKLDRADLALMDYRGVVRRDGQRLHLFRLPDIDWPAVLEGIRPSGADGIVDVVGEMLVNDRGLVISEDLTMYVEPDGGGAPIGVDVEMTYSRYGAPVEITKPRIESDTPQG